MSDDQNDAIQEDATAEIMQEDEQLEAIAAAAEARRFGDQQLESQLAEPEQAPPADTPADTQQAPAQAPARVKVKVEGEEKEVDVDTLVRTYQINAAADKRLQEATRLRAEAQALLDKQLAAQTQAIAQDEQTSPDLAKEARSVFEQWERDGDQAAAEALVQLIEKATGGNAPTQVPEEEIARHVRAQLLAEQEQTEFERALAQAQQDFPIVFADPNIEEVAAQKIRNEVAAGRSRAEATISVCKAMHDSFTAASAPQTSTRQQNKQRLDTIPTASATAARPQSQPESRESVIAELRASRPGAQTL